MSLLMRIAVITLGLAVAGFGAGWMVGGLMMLGWMLAEGTFSFSAEGVWEVLRFAAMFGGVVGAVLGPAAAWLLMRHVPLGMAVGGTAAGTIAGAVAGLVVAGFQGSFILALAGFAVSAVWLRIRVRRNLGAGGGASIARAPHSV